MELLLCIFVFIGHHQETAQHVAKYRAQIFDNRNTGHAHTSIHTGVRFRERVEMRVDIMVKDKQR